MGVLNSKPFRNGTPTLHDYTECHPMMNGILYRLSDRKRARWGFYNDSEWYTIRVAILFDYDSQIVPLGATSLYRIEDPEIGKEEDTGKYLAEVDIAPRATEMFVEGSITGWNVELLEARSHEDRKTFLL